MHTVNIEIIECISGRLQEVKNNGKSLTIRLMITGGVRLLEVPTVRL